jgi:hypothetical protein
MSTSGWKGLVTGLALVFPLLAATGCSDGRRTVYPVDGSVTWKGKIPAGAQVVFHPVGRTDKDAIRPTGQVDEEGHFTLTTFSAGDGAPSGQYDVTVVWWVSPGKSQPAVNKLPAAYARPDTSGQRITVSAGANNHQTINLK